MRNALENTVQDTDILFEHFLNSKSCIGGSYQICHIIPVAFQALGAVVWFLPCAIPLR